jgi:hypothetical protein
MTYKPLVLIVILFLISGPCFSEGESEAPSSSSHSKSGLFFGLGAGYAGAKMGGDYNYDSGGDVAGTIYVGVRLINFGILRPLAFTLRGEKVWVSDQSDNRSDQTAKSANLRLRLGMLSFEGGYAWGSVWQRKRLDTTGEIRETTGDAKGYHVGAQLMNLNANTYSGFDFTYNALTSKEQKVVVHSGTPSTSTITRDLDFSFWSIMFVTGVSL